MDEKQLVILALEAREKAYAPYSNFKVGAALVAGSGKVYTGANIENVAFGPTNCAERTAVFKAVSEGEDRIDMIAIASDSQDYIYPCGVCRQVLAEFGDDKTKVICSRKNGDYNVYTLGELLPFAFRKIDV